MPEADRAASPLTKPQWLLLWNTEPSPPFHTPASWVLTLSRSLWELPDSCPSRLPPSAMTWPGIESAAHTTDSLQLCSSALPLAKVPHLNSEDTGSLTTWPLASFLAKPHTCMPWISRSQISSYTTFHFLKTRQLAHTPRWPEIPFQFPTGKQAQTWPALEESPSVPGKPTLLNSVPTASPPPVLPCALVHSFSYLVFSFTFASSGHST